MDLIIIFTALPAEKPIGRRREGAIICVRILALVLSMILGYVGLGGGEE